MFRALQLLNGKSDNFGQKAKVAGNAMPFLRHPSFEIIWPQNQEKNNFGPFRPNWAQKWAQKGKKLPWGPKNPKNRKLLNIVI